jgi:hypothetical protein
LVAQTQLRGLYASPVWPYWLAYDVIEGLCAYGSSALVVEAELVKAWL